MIAEEAKPAEEQRPNKVLAHDIHEEIRGKCKRLPKESTLEKKIQKLRSKLREGRSCEDEPWSLFTLKRHPIPPEALPKVLEVYKNLRSHPEWQEPRLTIRDARWIAQLSETEALERWPFVYRLVSQAEQLYELIGEHAHFTFLDDVLAYAEFRESEYALELREFFEQWIYRTYEQISVDQKEKPKEGGEEQ